MGSKAADVMIAEVWQRENIWRSAHVRPSPENDTGSRCKMWRREVHEAFFAPRAAAAISYFSARPCCRLSPRCRAARRHAACR